MHLRTIPGEGIYRSTISFYDVHETPAVQLPFRSPDGLVEIRVLDPECAHSVCGKPRLLRRPGDQLAGHGQGRSTALPPSSHSRSALPRPAATAVAVSFLDVGSAIARCGWSVENGAGAASIGACMQVSRSADESASIHGKALLMR